jgi:hypothetical protein
MLLGILLIGVVILVRRWPGGGIRHGYTAERISGKDRTRLDAASMVLGAVAPGVIQATPAPGHPEVRFKGADSGGGGASGDY